MEEKTIEEKVVEQAAVKKKTQWWKFILFLSALGYVFLVLYGFYVTFRRVKIIEVYNQPVPVIKTDIKPGEPIVIHSNFCKFTNAFATVYPSMVGIDAPEDLINLAPYPSDFPKGCYNEDVRIGRVPLSAPSGTYFLRITVLYEANALQKGRVIVESQPFEVGEGKILYLP